MDFMELMKERFSARAFEDKPAGNAGADIGSGLGGSDCP